MCNFLTLPVFPPPVLLGSCASNVWFKLSLKNDSHDLFCLFDILDGSIKLANEMSTSWILGVSWDLQSYSATTYNQIIDLGYAVKK